MIRTIDEARVAMATPAFWDRYFAALDRMDAGEINSLPALCDAVGFADEAARSWIEYGRKTGIVRPAGRDAKGREMASVVGTKIYVNRVLNA